MRGLRLDRIVEVGQKASLAGREFFSDEPNGCTFIDSIHAPRQTPSLAVRRIERTIDGLLAKSECFRVVILDFDEASGSFTIMLDGKLQRTSPRALAGRTSSSPGVSRGARPR